MKTITFAIPCYNSAEYMDKCIESLLPCGDDIEIILINDGSTKDNTAEKVDTWAKKYPNIIKAIHQENGGHGQAVNSGLKNATGVYFKVVDSDDWLDIPSMHKIMIYLRSQLNMQHPTDMVISNYVYEKVHTCTSLPMRYIGVFPVEEEFGWKDVGHFGISQYILMHSVFYRTQLLRDIKLELPKHCFYVDNIFVYAPLPFVKSMYYINADTYRYFIGRDDQSVNESIMMSRVDQQLLITRIMIDSIDISNVEDRQLQAYLLNYLSMMMCICSVFLRMRNTPEDDKKLKEIWEYLKGKSPTLYKKIRKNILNFSTNIPTEIGRRLGICGYRLAQKLFKFN